jgi:hypothetical protein
MCRHITVSYEQVLLLCHSPGRTYEKPKKSSAFIRAQIRNTNAEVIREPSSFVSGDNNFYRADYKRSENGIMVYSSMVCINRNGYWLSWNFVTPSQQDLDRAVNTLQYISFDRASPR